MYTKSLVLECHSAGCWLQLRVKSFVLRNVTCKELAGLVYAVQEHGKDNWLLLYKWDTAKTVLNCIFTNKLNTSKVLTL